MMLLCIFVLSALLVVALTSILNALVFPRIRPALPSEQASVSILIPARNEADVIGKTVSTLLSQTHRNFELIILDDNSEDGTGDVACAAGAGDPRLRVIHGKTLPPNWAGKSWACHQLSQEASHALLLFTDADVHWHPDALSGLLAMRNHTNADLLTVWPTQKTQTWAERLVVPLMGFAILGYLPVVMTHHSPFTIFAAANGQCMLWHRNAYERVGGHGRVANSVLDDVTLARAAKRAGLRLRMADGNTHVSCRMYTGWPQVRDGFAKNILAGYGSAAALLVATVFHLLVFIVPWIWLLIPGWQIWGLAAIALGILIRALTAAVTQQRILDSLLLPISVLLMTRIAIQAMIWHYTGGPRWKGRVIDPSGKPPTQHTKQRHPANG